MGDGEGRDRAGGAGGGFGSNGRVGLRDKGFGREGEVGNHS